MATQFNMKDCEKAGLLKFDFLGLANLTIIDETLKLIKSNHNLEIDLTELPFNDLKSFELLGKGLTCGVFQVESAGMVDTLIKLKPTNLEEVIAVLALNRPGPPFRRRRRNHRRRASPCRSRGGRGLSVSDPLAERAPCVN